jgi:uncharacterized protein YdhG (YjbR/CyaY superfamily)
MEEKKNAVNTIDDYILQFSASVQTTLQQLRSVIKEAAPDADEKISWQMPTFVLHGNLVHFAAYKKHVGFYPGASGIEVFKSRLTEYKTSKGAVQFPIGKPIPYALISEIVRFRVSENIKISQAKTRDKKKS